MDSLTDPQWQVMSDDTRQVMQTLAGVVTLAPFYLAGGTALALRLGHRVSVDLDFFGFVDTFEDDRRNALVQQFRTSFQVEVMRNSPLALTIYVNGVSVSFFTYTYSLLDATEEVVGIPLAGISDIGLMKVEAIAERGARKDFIDLYFIAKHISLEKLFDASSIKYPGTRFFEVRALEGLVEFERADAQAPPKMLVPVDWEEVKQFFRTEAVRLGKKRFEDL